jgi:hypothetical protein
MHARTPDAEQGGCGCAAFFDLLGTFTWRR